MDFANTWEMHKFHKSYNDMSASRTLRDKQAFRVNMSKFTAGTYTSLDRRSEAIEWVSARAGSRIVAKHPTGAAGRSVSIHQVERTGGRLRIDCEDVDLALRKLRKDGKTLLEEYLVQHRVLNEIYSSALNTVRIITFIDDTGQVEFWAALLRIGNGGSVDNFDAGGITAQINLETGVVEGPLVLKDPFSRKLDRTHPLTGAEVLGARLPYWEEGLQLVREAALSNRSVRTVGWDLILLETGPAILEGNDNWDKTHFQLGVGSPVGNLIRDRLIPNGGTRRTLD